MTEFIGDWCECLPHLLALAARLEGEGQYNNAKLIRGAIDALNRMAAYKIKLPSDKEGLVNELNKAVETLKSFDFNKELIEAMKLGISALADGRLPLINETPHVYVCRTCGNLVLNEPEKKCATCKARSTTFKHFLPVYWLNALEPFMALDRLNQTPSDVATLLEGLSEEDFNQQPIDGGWAIRNVVSHLRDAQGVLSYRLNILLERDNPQIESKAVFEWATSEEDRPPTTQEIYTVYKSARQDTISKLEAMPLKDWWRTGRHEEFGAVTIRQQVSYFASHEITHLPQIESLRDELLKARE